VPLNPVMRALVCRAIGPFAESLVVKQVADPKPNEGEGATSSPTFASHSCAVTLQFDMQILIASVPSGAEPTVDPGGRRHFAHFVVAATALLWATGPLQVQVQHEITAGGVVVWWLQCPD
jgi:hypothetical protein